MELIFKFIGSLLDFLDDADNGERVKTEQEYIQTCTTEQLAEVLFSWYKLGRIDVINKHTELKKDWLIGWLKQPHKEVKND